MVQVNDCNDFYISRRGGMKQDIFTSDDVVCFSDASNIEMEEPECDVDLLASQTPSKKKRQGPFERLGLEPFVVKAVAKAGFSLPTPIQRKAIPSILSGRDVVAMACTGSGKTAAFALPLIQKLASHRTIVGIRAVILEPTRELAFQVAKVVRQLAHFTDLRLCVIVGGCGFEAQFEKLTNNPDIVVASPGRLVHHLVEAKLSLSAVEYLVVDEADQMFELGVGDQVEQILKGLNSSRQCVLMSATLPSALVNFSRVGLRSPELIRLDVSQNLSDTLEMWFLYTRADEKLAAIIYILREILLVPYIPGRPQFPQGVVVFVASRHHVDFVGALLKRAGIPTSVAYGSMDQQARIESLSNFRKGLTKVFVVTDIAARGLDIPTLGAVINVDFPISPKHFVHRVGRTARAGRPGMAISLITHDEMAYAVEVLLFGGVKFEVASSATPAKTGTPSPVEATSGIPGIHTLTELPQKNDANSRKNVWIGGTPDLSDDVEFVRKVLDEDAELANLYKTMMNATKQYIKSRRPASRQSIRRAKELLKTDVGKLLHTVHPTLAEWLEARGVKTTVESDRAKFLEMLRFVKPKTTSSKKKGGREGGILSPTTTAKMETLCYLRNLRNFTVSHGQGDSQENNREDDTSMETHSSLADISELPSFSLAGQTNGSNTSSDSPWFTSTPSQDVAEPERRRPLSAAARRALKRSGGRSTAASSPSLALLPTLFTPLPTAATVTQQPADVFDWRSRAKARTSHFFLCTEKSEEEAASLLREKHLSVGDAHADGTSGLKAMLEAQFDLVPDEPDRQKSVQHVRKWNPLKKKYVMTPVDPTTGAVLRAKQVKKRNEAGVICRGELQHSGAYEKWVRQSKKRIQRVGELEDVQEHSLTRGRTASKRVQLEEDNDGSDSDDAHNKPSRSKQRDEALPPLTNFTKDKGLIEAIETGAPLTKKQQRKAKKILSAQKGVVRQAPRHIQDEVRDARQLARVKKEALKQKAKHNVRFRMEMRKKSKEKHMRKRQHQAEAKAAHRRSFPLPATKPRRRL